MATLRSNIATHAELSVPRSPMAQNRPVQLSAAVRRASVLNAADPGRIRLRSAAATTCSLLVAIGAMLAFTHAAGQPITVAVGSGATAATPVTATPTFAG